MNTPDPKEVSTWLESIGFRQDALATGHYFKHDNDQYVTIELSSAQFFYTELQKAKETTRLATLEEVERVIRERGIKQ